MNWLSVVIGLFTKAHLNPEAAANKLMQVQTGISTVQSVVDSLPPGSTTAEAHRALQAAATAVATAIAIAHTAEAAG